MEKIYENPNNIILRHILSSPKFPISRDDYTIDFYVDILEEKIIDIKDTHIPISLKYKFNIDLLKYDLNELEFNECIIDAAETSNMTKRNKIYFLKESLNQEIIYPRKRILVYEYLVKSINNKKVEVISNFLGYGLRGKRLPKNIQVKPINTNLISNINTNLNYNIF